MSLLYFFICSLVLTTILSFILTRPEEYEKRSTFILEIITLSVLLTIAEAIIVLIIFMVISIFLGVLVSFGVIG